MTSGNIQASSQTKPTSDKDETEVFVGKGIITALDNSMPNGVIDRQYQFSIEKFCSAEGGEGLQRGSKVEFRAERTRKRPQWIVTYMKKEESAMEKINKERCKFRRVVAVVIEIQQDQITVEAGKQKTALSRTFSIPNQLAETVGFRWMRGYFNENYSGYLTICNSSKNNND